MLICPISGQATKNRKTTDTTGQNTIQVQYSYDISDHHHHIVLHRHHPIIIIIITTISISNSCDGTL